MIESHSSPASGPIHTQRTIRQLLTVLLVLTAIMLVMAEPIAMILSFVLLSVLSFYSRKIALVTLVTSSLISVFYWLYLSYAYHLELYLSTSYWAAAKAALVLPMIASLFALMHFKVIKYDRSYKYLLVFLAILALSLLKGMLTSPFVSVAYLVNVYFPLLLQFLIVAWVSNYIASKGLSGSRYIGSPTFKLLIFVVLFFSTVFFVLQSIFDFSLNDIFLDIGQLLGRGGAEGNTRTVLFGMRLERFPGLFADPILAAYSLFLFFAYIWFFVRHIAAKVIGLVCCVVLAVATFSKAFFFLLACFIAVNVCLRLKASDGVKFALSLFATGCAVLIISLRALMAGITDSSAIHVQGLILPFVSAESVVSFFIGHDLGTGGNMGGWVTQGAESFIGLVMYNTGLIGLLCLALFCLSVLRSAVKTRTNAGYFLFSVSLSILSASFLQENSFNLSFSVLRVCCYTLILYSILKVVGFNERKNL